MKRCEGINQDGTRCKRKLRRGDCCLEHNPMLGYERPKPKKNKRKQSLIIKFDLRRKGSPITQEDVKRCKNKEDKIELLSMYYAWLNATRRDDKYAVKKYNDNIKAKLRYLDQKGSQKKR